MARPKKPEWVLNADEIIAKSAYAMIMMGYPANPKESFYYEKFTDRYVFSVLGKIAREILGRSANSQQDKDDPFKGDALSPDSIKKIFKEWMDTNEHLFRATIFKKDSYELANKNGHGLGTYSLTDIATELVKNEGFLADNYCWVNGIECRYLEIFPPVPLDWSDVTKVENQDEIRDYGIYINLPEKLMFIADVIKMGFEVKFSGRAF